MKLKDKVAIITGAGQGIGKEYALRFAREGAKVVISEIKLENAQQVAQEIESKGGKALAIRTDVSVEADALQVAKKTIDTFGRIDVLVNNAAIYYGREFKPFEFISEKDWDASMAVNVKGLFFMSRAVMPQMKKQKSGSIINISSSTWLMGVPYLLDYVTTKAAVVGLTRALAREIGEHNARRMSRRFWGRKMQFIAFVRAKNRAERSPKGVGSIGLVRRSALRGAVQVQSSIRRALGRSAKRSALTLGMRGASLRAFLSMLLFGDLFIRY